jgi:uncharacterized protein (DUF362 family)
MSTLSRRAALQRIVLGAAGLSLTAASRGRATEALPRCAIARGAPPATLTRRALDALGGMRRFVAPDQRVVVKPNIGWDRAPEQAATTHPEIVATLVALAREAGAGEVLVMDHTCNDARRCYARSGIEQAAREAGARVIHLRQGRGVEMEIGGQRVRSWPVFRELREADVLINVPIVKHHGLCRATLGMKNWFGAVDGRRNQLHQDVAHSCVDLAAFFRPALTVLDATRILLRNGPQGGNLEDVAHPRTLMAGTDPVAVEAFGGSLLQLSPADLPQIALAEARGLGRADWQAADVPVLDLEAAGD